MPRTAARERYREVALCVFFGENCFVLFRYLFAGSSSHVSCVCMRPGGQAGWNSKRSRQWHCRWSSIAADVV
jgi:hypothetical protein